MQCKINVGLHITNQINHSLQEFDFYFDESNSPYIKKKTFRRSLHNMMTNHSECE